MVMVAVTATAGNRPGGRRKLSSQRKAESMLRRAFVVAIALFCSAAVSSVAEPSIEELPDNPSQSQRECTVDDLLPDHEWDGDFAEMWDPDTLVHPPFDCSCNTLKASYFCPRLGHEGYPKWTPRAVSDGTCKAVSRALFKTDPFPSDFKILFYGNSHLRQVVEGIVCMYSHCVQNRRVTLVDDSSHITEDVMVGPEIQCRGCVNRKHAMRRVLENNGCFDEFGAGADKACSCSDNRSVFQFDNGATMHYHFAHLEASKRLEDAITVHETGFEDYDMVVGNPGNDPRMPPEELLRSANDLKEEGVPLIWLSTYEGEGDVDQWSDEQRAEFKESGAKFVPIHRMVESLEYLTKGVVEGEHNPHFCMPGPPNEIGIVLMKAAWAMRAASERGG